MVSKDEIIEKIWDGRIVSESALTSRIKSARKALGDDGKTQGFIRTVHGQGFRFVAEAKPVRLVARVVDSVDAETSAARSGAPIETMAGAALADMPSIAVLPFRLVGVAGPHAGIADALPHELISVLARLRWLFVIARGLSFRFRAAEPDISEIGRALQVRYCLFGVIEIAGDRLAVTVELSDTRDCSVLWGDRFAANVDDTITSVSRSFPASYRPWKFKSP